MIESGIAACFDEIKRQTAHLSEAATPQEHREFRELIAETLPPQVPTGMRIRNRFLNAPGRQILIRGYDPAAYAITPDTPPSARVIYFHGGGFVSGSVFSHDVYCVALAHTVGLPVISVNYRLAPENPFPAALDDCFFVMQWIAEHGDVCAGPPQRLILCGDSAGGTLAAACAIKARNEDGPLVTLQVLLYPCLGTDFTTESYRNNTQDPALSLKSMQMFWKSYLIEGGDGDPLATPLALEDMSGLPPAYVLTADLDPLRDDGLMYAERLTKAGVPTTVRNVSGGIHGLLRAFAHSQVVQEELRLLAKAIQQAAH